MDRAERVAVTDRSKITVKPERGTAVVRAFVDVDGHFTARPPTSFRRPAVPLSVGDKQVQTLRERTMPEAKVDLDTGRETGSLNTSGVFLKKSPTILEDCQGNSPSLRFRMFRLYRPTSKLP